jgi:hypothetical protein
MPYFVSASILARHELFDNPSGVAVQQASADCGGAGGMAGYPVSSGSMPGGIQGLPLNSLRRASILGMPHLAAVER